MKVKDLKKGERERRLSCGTCGTQVSADANDYFNSSPDADFVCCGEDMRLEPIGGNVTPIRDRGDLDEGPMYAAGDGLLQRQVVLRYVGGFQPYVTHLRIFGPEGEVDHCWGHYFHTELEARKDFEDRKERGY